MLICDGNTKVSTLCFVICFKNIYFYELYFLLIIKYCNISIKSETISDALSTFLKSLKKTFVFKETYNLLSDINSLC